MKDRIAKKDWTTVSSLKKLEDGEKARVFWPKEAHGDPDRPLGYRYGRISVETIPGKVEAGVRTPDKRGAVFFEWVEVQANIQTDTEEQLGRIQIEYPKQVEVRREKSASGGTRRLG